MGNNILTFIAHQREIDGEIQKLEKHLCGVANKSKSYSSKIGLGVQGEIIGLLHDLGKYSSEFQAYLQSAVGMIKPDEDDFVDATGLKGKIDHSSAGAQYIWNRLKTKGSEKITVGQILALCIASHHSGLIDCLTPDGENNFSRRMAKPEKKCHLKEAEISADRKIISTAKRILEDENLTILLIKKIKGIYRHTKAKNTIFYFQVGLLVRYIFSCLIDADRLDTANFESPETIKQRPLGNYLGWGELVNRLNRRLDSFSSEKEINRIRADVSQHCFEKSESPKGLFTLHVPTGGGKTLASLRFALHHAKKHDMERIFYVVPYTSVIDQNADEVRRILENADTDKRGSVVLECHSNLIFENNKTQWREKLLAENWDAPVVFTTSVQFLDCLFSGGTRNARRMHQLANSVIIFDEIQTLPIRMVHMFNNAINFLTQCCDASVVLCTATQPLLGNVDKEKGCLSLSLSNEIVHDTQKLFSDLKRVKIVDKTKYSGEWCDEEIVELANGSINSSGSCLIIVNTKRKAKTIFEQCQKNISIKNIYHLSTNMCAAHRLEILEDIKNKLDREPVLCVSTQLIEAGVDIDFGSVIRSIAGLDSIAQAAGRCNRNGKNKMGHVYVINPESEKIGMLPDIEKGKAMSERVFREFSRDPASLGGDLLNPKAMKRYFKYYFFESKNEMSYSVGGRNGKPKDTLLNMLSKNAGACDEHRRINGDQNPSIPLRQSFMAANKKFEVIGAGTQGIIVPHGEKGKDIISDLCRAFNLEKDYMLLKLAQRYTVNVYPHMIKKLSDAGAIQEVQENSGIYYLKKENYSEDFGVSEHIVNEMETLCP